MFKKFVRFLITLISNYHNHNLRRFDYNAKLFIIASHILLLYMNFEALKYLMMWKALTATCWILTFCPLARFGIVKQVCIAGKVNIVTWITRCPLRLARVSSSAYETHIPVTLADSELMAQSVGALPPGLCLAECHRFEPRPLIDHFSRYRLPCTDKVRSLSLSISSQHRTIAIWWRREK